MGKPRHLVDLRPELQQRDASSTPQRARLVGRHRRRSRHAVPGARRDRPVSAACRMGLAPGAAHRARAAARPPAAVAACRDAARSGALRSAPAEELAIAQRPWRHPRRSVHDRGAVHRRAAGRRSVLRCRASFPHRRHLAPALRLRHQHLLAHRALGAALEDFRANGPMPRWAPRCMSPCHTGATIKRGFWWRKAGDGAEEEPELEVAAPAEDAEPDPDGRIEPTFDLEPYAYDDEEEEEDEEDDEGDDVTEPNYRITRTAEKKKHTGPRVQRSDTPYEAPPLKLLAAAAALEQENRNQRRSACRRMRASSKACSRISASRARSPMCAPAPWSRSTSSSRRPAPNPRASSGLPTTSPAP